MTLTHPSDTNANVGSVDKGCVLGAFFIQSEISIPEMILFQKPCRVEKISTDTVG